MEVLTVRNVVVVAGHAGSGKSEFSKLLSARTGWPLLDKDTLTGPLVEKLARHITGDQHDRHSSYYNREIRPLEYQTLMETMWEVLEFGSSGAVVTAPFVQELSDPNWLDKLTFDCETKEIDLTVVWVHCDREKLKDRLIARGAGRDRWKLMNWPEWTASLEEPPLSTYKMHVDNSSDSLVPLSESVAELTRWLRSA